MRPVGVVLWPAPLRASVRLLLHVNSVVERHGAANEVVGPGEAATRERLKKITKLLPFHGVIIMDESYNVLSGIVLAVEGVMAQRYPVDIGPEIPVQPELVIATGVARAQQFQILQTKPDCLPEMTSAKAKSVIRRLKADGVAHIAQRLKRLSGQRGFARQAQSARHAPARCVHRHLHVLIP